MGNFSIFSFILEFDLVIDMEDLGSVYNLLCEIED